MSDRETNGSVPILRGDFGSRVMPRPIRNPNILTPLPAIKSSSPPAAELRQGDRVVVCGAGPAGLTAAYMLAKKGFAVTVLEADSTVGGISRTARYKTYRFDVGGIASLRRFLLSSRCGKSCWEKS